MSPEFLNEELLKGVETKWMMSTLRHKKKMNLFAGGNLFGIVDIMYQKGGSNLDYQDMSLPSNVTQLESKAEKSIRVGFMGLVYKSWMETSELDFKDFKLEECFSVGADLAQMLKTRFKCDLVVALTHMSNDEDQHLQNLNSEIDISAFSYLF